MKDFTEGNVSKLILNFSVPLLLGNVFQSLYSIIDSIIVGRYLGTKALAAVGASYPIIFFIIALVIGIGGGGSIVIAQYFGAKQYDKVKQAADTINIFLLAAGLIVAVSGFFLAKPILRLIQLPNELLDDAALFLKIYLGGMVAFFGFNGVISTLRGVGDSKTPLYFLIVSIIANIVLDILFIGVFGWGIAGAAWATLIAQLGAFISAIVYINRTHDVFRFAVKGMTFNREIFRHCIKIGLPSGFQQTFVALGMTALMGIVNTFGTDVIAAYSTASRIDSLAMMPAMSFSVALSTFVGQNVALQNFERIKKGLASTLLMSLVIAVIISLAIILLGKDMMRMFTNNSNVIGIGSEYLTVVSLFYWMFTIMFVVNGLLRGAGATMVPMLTTLVSLWAVRVPAAFLLSKYIGESGIWWSIPIGWVFGMIGAYAYYKTGKWKNKTVFHRTKMSQSEEAMMGEMEV